MFGCASRVLKARVCMVKGGLSKKFTTIMRLFPTGSVMVGMSLEACTTSQSGSRSKVIWLAWLNTINCYRKLSHGGGGGTLRGVQFT